MRFHGIIFDLDGTLLDTIKDIANAMNNVLKKLGYPVHSTESYCCFIGEGIEKLVRRALPQQAFTDAFVSQCIDSMKKEYDRCWKMHSGPYAGVPELLGCLQEQHMPMAILSNKPHDFTKIMVEALLPRWSFCKVWGARPSVPNKPDPAAALQIARDFALSPDQVLFLGDTKTDMETANRAGMYPVGALWGFRDEQELRQSGAKELIENPLDLLKILK